MAIKPKPKRDETTELPKADEKTIEALINKGGSSTKVQPTPKDEDAEKKPIKLILYKSHHKEIDTVLSKLPKRIRPSRHAYIIQAIEEKVQRDMKKLK